MMLGVIISACMTCINCMFLAALRNRKKELFTRGGRTCTLCMSCSLGEWA
jgi:hypothetical protein